MVVGYQPGKTKISMLTAALQEIVPRERLRNDPDAFVLAWIEYAKRLGLDSIQLAAALPPELSNVSAEQLMDPVADHLRVDIPFTEARAERIKGALAEANLSIDSIGYFDDHLIDDPEQRRIKFDHMMKVMDAAVLLGVKQICGFVGRSQSQDMQQNLGAFHDRFIPIVQAASDRDQFYLAEHCPMPGLNATDTVINNIAYCPGMWCRLHEICQEYDLGDNFAITYDPSHSILLGQNPVTVIRQLIDYGHNDLIRGLHVKGMVIDQEAINKWGYWGQTIDRGDHTDQGELETDPELLGNAWKVMPCEHELPGTAHHDPLGYLQCQTVDWFGLFYELRDMIDMSEVPLVIEHEFSPARFRDPDKLAPILAASIDFVRHIDAAAEAMWQLHNGLLPKARIRVQGRRAYCYLID